MAKNDSVMILPNGYGSLKYVDSLQAVLSSENKNVYVPILRGTRAQKGELGIKSACEDIALCLNSAVFPVRSYETI